MKKLSNDGNPKALPPRQKGFRTQLSEQMEKRRMAVGDESDVTTVDDNSEWTE